VADATRLAQIHVALKKLSRAMEVPNSATKIATIHWTTAVQEKPAVHCAAPE
jgi:hypothetical protein